MGPGPWTSWLAPSVVQDPGGLVPAFTRFNAPGNTDPNHLDGIGALFLVAHLSIPTVGSAGILDLRDAEFEITIRGTDFQANGGRLMVWVCRYIPEEGVIRNYYVGLQVTNWANTGNDLASQLTDEWQTLTVQLSDDPEDWTYAGNAVSSQGDWADRYQPLDLGQSLERVDATLHLVFVSDEPDEHPTGFLDIANITVRTQTPATPTGLAGADVDIFYGLEDEDAGGALALPPEINPAGAQFSVVSGSARNGTVTIDPDTGVFVFTPNANYYGPTDFIGAATFQYTVTDGSSTSAPRTVVVFVGPINDAPSTSTADVLMEAAHDQAFAYTVFKPADVDEERLTFHVVDGSSLHGTVVMDEETGRYVFTPDAGYTGVAEFQYVVSDGQLESAPATISINFHAAGDDPVLPTYNDVVEDYLLAGDIAGWRRYVVLLADEGDTNAAYHYGTWLHFGQGVTRDATLSAQYLSMAAATVPDAALQLADMYLSGDGVPKDYVAARALLEMLPTNKTAIYRLAMLDDLGFGAPQDHARAVEGFLEAAKLGQADAMYTLGRRYLMAEGVAFSAEDAYFWLGVALKYDAGPPFAASVTQFDDLLRYNQQQAVDQAGLTPQQVADLDLLVAAWTIGDPSPVNQAPEPGEDVPASGDAGAPIQGQLAAAEDSDGDHLTYLLVPGSAENGTVTIDPVTGEWEFTPAPGYSGPASFQYVVSDGESQSVASIVNLEFAPVTDALNDTGQLDEAATLTVDAAAGLLANDVLSPDGVSLTVSAVNGEAGDVGQPVAGAYGSITINADGSYTYVADASTAALLQGQTYVESFTYAVIDGEGVVDTATLQITINGVSGTVLSGSGVLIGSAFADVITGGAAHDTLLGLGGNDRLIGGAGAADELYGGTGDDTFVIANAGDSIVENADEGTDTVETALSVFVQRNNVENLTYTGGGAFIGTGNGLNNVITGGTGADVLNGAAGNDVLLGGTGAANTMLGGTGDDVFHVSVAGDSYIESAGEGTDGVITGVSSLTLRAHVENLTYVGLGSFAGTGNAEANIITADAGNDVLNGLGGADTLIGGEGDDIYYVDDAGDEIVEQDGDGTDTVRSTAASYALDDHVENAAMWGGAAGVLTGNGLGNALTGGAGDDTLDGGAGDDVMSGGLGSDTYVVQDAGDQVIDTGGAADHVQTVIDYTLAAGIEHGTILGSDGRHLTGNGLNNILAGGDGSDLLEGAAGADTLDGGVGDDILAGGLGDDIYYVDSAADVVTEAAAEGEDTVRTTLSVYALGENVENLEGLEDSTDYTLTGNDLDNTIVGAGGADTLEGGLGSDTLLGGDGDDAYIVDDAFDTVVEASDEGTDTVYTTVAAYVLADNVDNLTYTGASPFLGYGNDLNNVITGCAGDDTLRGYGGHDLLIGEEGANFLIGGTGNDVYVVSSADDIVYEEADEGFDTVQTSLDAFALHANVETLIYTGSGDFEGTGNSGDNALQGGVGNDVLDGGAGADDLDGREGDDTYIVDDAGDAIYEVSGTDEVRALLATYTLGAGLENLTYVGVSDATLTGNGLANVITGGDEDDTLDGGAGDDTLIGGLGDDIYLVDSADDEVVELEDEGYDEVQTTLSTYTLGDHLEDLTFTGAGAFTGVGNALENYLTGGGGDDALQGLDGDDWLNGGAGADTLEGGEGDDLYTVDDAGDVVTDTGGDFDEVETTLATYTLTAGIEALSFIGTGDFVGVGNTLDNDIYGGDDNDTLDGMDGDDLLAGGDGEDVLNGGAGNDLMAGEFGDDTMSGGLGDDIYAVEDAGDVVVELEDEGLDVVQTLLGAYTLTANVEALFYAGFDNFTGVGNDLDNLIVGGDGDDDLSGGEGNDALFGGFGADTMRGGLGEDAYFVEDENDVVIELENEGIDHVDTTLNVYTLGDNVEGLGFLGSGDFQGYGNALDNTMYGGDGDDLLIGDEGADTMEGGLGSDDYSVDDAGDVVVEAASEGDDAIYIEGDVGGSYTLADNVENLYLAYAAAMSLTGNGLNNTIHGFAMNDVIDGGLGADTMRGGDGDDLYHVDDIGDVVGEDAGEGHDTIRATAASVVMGADVEDLIFDGAGAFSGTGNASDNAMTGGAGADTMDGGDGDDSLIGHGGIDVLTGGAGVDTIDYASAAAGVVVRLDLSRATNDGDGASDTLNGFEDVVGTGFTDTIFGNALGNVLTGGAGADTLLGLAGNDVLVGGDGVANQLQGGLGDDRYVVTANDSLIEAAGEGIDVVETSRAAFTLGANLENLIFTGASAFTGTGNTGDNAITGGAANDLLSGGAGADTLTGGDGDDVLRGGAGVDVLAGGSGTDGVDYSLAAAGAVVRLDLQRATNDGDGGTDTYSGVENAVGSGFNDILFGSAIANILSGGLGADTLLGLAGNDTLIGGAGQANQLQGGQGDDLYIVTASDSIIELSGEGHDTVQTSQSTFNLSANVEDLTFTGVGAFTANGSAIANVIRGGLGADTIDGKDGDDTLWGGVGHDSLTGGLGADTLNGEDGNDILNGGAGDDILTGGLGNDRYVIDSAGDQIVELPGAGTDTVETTLASWTLVDGLENLTFTGAGGFTGIGNAGNNVITGGVGNDTFVAGLGNDTFNGGAGADTVDYSAVGSAVVVKLNGNVAQNDGQGGTDSLVGIETVIGTAFDDTMIGDNLANTLLGGTGRDTLIGGGGADVLVGGVGLANLMQGGLGDDIYLVSVATDSVVELSGEGTDTVETTLAAYTLGANIERLTHTGPGAFTGAGNALANILTGGSGDDLLRGAAGNDTLQGGDGNDIALFAGLQGAYTIVATAQGYQITDNAAGTDGDDGVDQLIGVERVRFKDGTTITLADLGLTPAPVLSGKDAPSQGDPLAQPSAAPAAAGEPEIQPWGGSLDTDSDQPQVQPAGDPPAEPLVVPTAGDLAVAAGMEEVTPLVLPAEDDFLPGFADDGRLVQPGLEVDDGLLADRPVSGGVRALADDPLVVMGPNGPVVLLPDEIVGAHHRPSDDGWAF